MEKFHLFDPELIVKTGMTFKDGADAIDRLIYNKVEFDAVFAFTDTLAIGAQNRLRALGKRVPEEIFVAGFSGTELSTIVSPQITAMVSDDNADDVYTYQLNYVEAGSYKLALVCNASADELTEAGNSSSFTPTVVEPPKEVQVDPTVTTTMTENF
jgi:ABC-type sugar transport system substrate-binding protein